MCDALADPARGERLRAAARDTVVRDYDLRTCLARQVQMIERVLRGAPGNPAPVG